MTKEQFLTQVALHDKYKGNYRETLDEYRFIERTSKLNRVDDRLIGLYSYLTKNNYNVFVYEILSGEAPDIVKQSYARMNRRPPKPGCFGRFAHLWIPELNMAIRFCNKPYGERDEKLGQFIYNSRDYCFLCVISPEDDPVEKFEKVLMDIQEYKKRGTANKRGIADTLVVPARKKRARITTTKKA